MAGGAERQCISMETNCILKVREDAPLLESDSKADGKIIER
jgi:hypothetical protein